jgi:hypothetical protein
LDKECSIDYPQNDGRDYSNLVSVPNRNSNEFNEHLMWEDRSIVDALTRTYTRRTINSEEAAMVKKAKT